MTAARTIADRRRAVRPDRRHRREPRDDRGPRGDGIRSGCSAGGVPRVLELLRRPVRRVARRARRRTSTGRSSRSSSASPPSHGVHIVAGLVERAGDGRRVRNAVVAVDGIGRAGALPQAAPLRRVRAARVRLGRAGRARRARDVRARRPALRAHDLLRPAVPRGRATAGGCRRRRVRRARRVGARPAEGAPLAHAHPRAGDREHRLRRGGGPPAAARASATR